jgi:hypothetical protein
VDDTEFWLLDPETLRIRRCEVDSSLHSKNSVWTLVRTRGCEWRDIKKEFVFPTMNAAAAARDGKRKPK